jgi:hypothetical protein
MDPPSAFADDALASEPLRALGWDVDAVPWRSRGVDWGAYEVVVIRSPWDYTRAPAAFLDTLAGIVRAGARLEKPLPLVRWNLEKTYLRDLAGRGVPVVPTVWRDGLRPGELPALLDEVGTEEAVVKPVVGASAGGAYRLGRRPAAALAAEVEAYYAGRPLMAQPFVRSVLDEGELSLVYLGGALSHVIRKTPRPADFRVQEEHGGTIRRVEPGDALLAAGAAVLGALGAPPLYARADLVRADDGAFWLMELELVEPSLYLRMDPAAPGRFAEALHRWIG